MFEYILFDLDGTLTDPKEGITKCVQYALQDQGFKEDDLEKLTCFIGPPLHKQFMAYCHMEEAAAKVAVEKYRERFSTIGLFENKVYQGIEGLLKVLQQQGKRLAVATSKPTLYATQICEHFGLASYFEVIVGSELDGSRVEKAEVIEETLRVLQISNEVKERVIMIGDREHDIIGAKINGITSIGVEYGYSSENELFEAGADYLVDGIKDLEAILLK